MSLPSPTAKQEVALDVALEAALDDAVTEVDDAKVAERRRCAAVVQHAVDEAKARGLAPEAPLVRVLAAIKHGIEVG